MVEKLTELENIPVSQLKKTISQVNKDLKITGHYKMKKNELIKRIEKHPMITVVPSKKHLELRVKLENLSGSPTKKFKLSAMKS